MEPGDVIYLTVGADRYTARILEAERYRQAWILYYRFVPSHRTAFCCVFPQLPQLPGASWFTHELYYLWGSLEWKGHLWPMPVHKPRRLLPNSDIRQIMRRRIDHILALPGLQGRVPEPVAIVPATEWEYRQWRKLEQNRGR